MMMPQAVFWDMDGTLIDSEPLHEQALVAVLKSLGITPPADLHDRVLGIAAFPVYEMLHDEFGLKLAFDDWIVRKYVYYMEHVGTLKPRPGAVEVFRDLRAQGTQQAVVSNSDRLVVEANMRVIGIDRPGMKTVTRNDVRLGKPDPEPFLRAAWLAEVDPSGACVVEDSWTGASAGVAAGMRTLFWPQQPAEAPPGAIYVASAEELRGHLGLD
ncbi:haloacid dehalogenase superfamily, subfamily IA, variant 3 with third motif having DD or ED [Mesorhizobium sp. YR577]|jgi:HAD superfamily hydrolase (TIGR01509 family)|nr:haloacid dehalogenase superfamily, subfamily IA, variant 3 with third motif having DD or ED [Mesorhizobium sp. YR577]